MLPGFRINSPESNLVKDVMIFHNVVPEQYRLRIESHLLFFAYMVNAVLEDGSIDLEKLKSMKVLDIACGSAYAYEPLDEQDSFKRESLPKEIERAMEPWLCRTLGTLGVDVTGIDIRFPSYKHTKVGSREQEKMRQRGEKVVRVKREGNKEPRWKFVQRDLRDPLAIDAQTFPDSNYDAVRCSGFIDGENSSLNDPNIELFSKRNFPDYIRMASAIYSNVERVLKDNGVFISNFAIKKKVDGKLITIPDEEGSRLTLLNQEIGRLLSSR